MIDNKYYTPDISEFYVGFEYELYCRDVNPTIKNGSTVWLKSWQAKTFTKAEFERGVGFDRNLDLQDDWIRVRYLDKEDIESLGFELKHTDCGEDTDNENFDIYSKYGAIIGRFYINGNKNNIELFSTI